VQFGVAYGVANSSGQISPDVGRAILRAARAGGMDTLDTAMSYGQSESRLGDLGVSDWRVVTKLPAHPDDVRDIAAWTEELLAGSLRRLRVERLYGLLLHRPDQLLEPNGDRLYDSLQRCKDQGLVEKIGVSIYDPQELDQLVDRYAIDVVQSPLSIVDRRLVDSGWLDRLSQDGIEVHARSVFLQGLLLMNQDERPEAFQRFEPLWSQWHAWLGESGLTPVEACLRYTLSFEQLRYVIVGVDSPDQLSEIVTASNGAAPGVPAFLSSTDPDLVNPSRWVTP
jgi:aryl-alcohol dehydrogenase-like predicted oxidoreductase